MGIRHFQNGHCNPWEAWKEKKYVSVPLLPLCGEINTTNTSNGSVNSMHDSSMPLSGMNAMLGMMVNALYGGVGGIFSTFTSSSSSRFSSVVWWWEEHRNFSVKKSRPVKWKLQWLYSYCIRCLFWQVLPRKVIWLRMIFQWVGGMLGECFRLAEQSGLSWIQWDVVWIPLLPQTMVVVWRIGRWQSVLEHHAAWLCYSQDFFQSLTGGNWDHSRRKIHPWKCRNTESRYSYIRTDDPGGYLKLVGLSFFPCTCFGANRRTFFPLLINCTIDMKRNTHSKLFDSALVIEAIRQSFIKLNPRVMFRNPVMFTVEVGTIYAWCLYLTRQEKSHKDHWYTTV